MNQSVTTFEITYGVSENEKKSGLIILQSKLYKIFSTAPSMK